MQTKTGKQHSTKSGHAAGAIAALLLCASAHAETPPAHYEQTCVACHARMTGGAGETLYQRKDRLVNNYDALLARIEHCRRGSRADWDETQRRETADYLNRRFYHFPQPR